MVSTLKDRLRRVPVPLLCLQQQCIDLNLHCLELLAWDLWRKGWPQTQEVKKAKPIWLPKLLGTLRGLIGTPSLNLEHLWRSWFGSKLQKKNQAACPSILHTHTKVSAAPKSIPTLQKKLRIREVKPSQLGSKTAYGRKVGMAQLQNDPGHKISLVFLRISDIILQAKNCALMRLVFYIQPKIDPVLPALCGRLPIKM